MAEMSENSVVEAEENDQNYLSLAAQVLSGNFPVIAKLVLSCLPAKSLNTAARVCKQWRQLVSEIKKGRTKLSWFMDVPDDEEEDEDASSYDLAEKLSVCIQSLWCEPETVLGFFTTDLLDERLMLPNKESSRSGRSRRAKCSTIDFNDYIINALPKGCTFVGVGADGAVGTEWGSAKSVESEGKKALTLLMLPRLEGVDVYRFTMNMYSERWLDTMDELQIQEVDIAVISKIPHNKKVKAVLFFCDEQFCPPEMGYSIMRQYKEAVVAGGYVDSLLLPPHLTADSNPGILCVAFCGENLQVASVLIRENVRTSQEVEKQILKLKDCQFPEEKSFAFMFACVGRGEGLYKKSNVESDAFRKIFPRTPLFGFFGNGEVGYNSFPDSASGSQRHQIDGSAKRILPKLYHAYTTVMCLFSVH